MKILILKKIFGPPDNIDCDIFVYPKNIDKDAAALAIWIAKKLGVEIIITEVDQMK